MRRLAALPFLALFLVGCDDRGYPNTDVETITLGIVAVAVIAGVCFAIWAVSR